MIKNVWVSHHIISKISRLLVILAALSVSSLIGCSDNNYYTDTEHALDTSGYYKLLDHIASYYPYGVSLNFPGYVVGLEETSTRVIANYDEDVFLDKSVFVSGYTVERLVKTLKFNLPFISHVMRYEGREYGEGNCALYNLYHYNGAAIVKPCSPDPGESSSTYENPTGTFARSWDAVDLLKNRLAEDVSTNNYTHLIVAVMGLDTDQEEAIRNFKSIISSIRKNAGSNFRPLFVGITWPSFYANRWFDPLWEALAYPPVADRADTLGLTWLGVLLNSAIMPLSNRIEVTVIAHSFGARAATMGLCIGPVLQRNRIEKPVSNDRWIFENFIGLAPAFSLKRFDDEDYLFYENVYYRDYCPVIKRFVFTASSNDAAFMPLFWNDPVGDFKQMEKYCKLNHPVTVECTSANADGAIKYFNKLTKITYIDTSSLMKYTMPGTKGAGHSDIFRPEIGKLLWSVVDAKD